jgi:hypothetical protein
MNPKLLLRAKHAIKLYKHSQKQTNRRGRQVCKALEMIIKSLRPTPTPSLLPLPNIELRPETNSIVYEGKVIKLGNYYQLFALPFEAYPDKAFIDVDEFWDDKGYPDKTFRFNLDHLNKKLRLKKISIFIRKKHDYLFIEHRKTYK